MQVPGKACLKLLPDLAEDLFAMKRGRKRPTPKNAQTSFIVDNG